MSTQLPAPHPGRVPATTASSSGGAAAPRRTVHWRRPRLERVTCLSYGNRRLAAAGGRVCCVWDTMTHALLRRLVTSGEISALSIARDRTAVAVAADAVVTVYDLATGAPRFAYPHGAEVASVHIDNECDVLASADVLGAVQIHDVATGRLVSTISATPGRPIVYIHRGRYVLIGSEKHSTIVDAITGETLRRFAYESSETPAQEGLLLHSTLVAHSGTMVRWFDCERFAPAHCIRNLGSTVQRIDLYDSRGLALAATEDGGLHLFDLESGAPRTRYSSFTSPILDARFGPNASLYVAGGEALVMQLEDGRHSRSYCDESPPLVAMTVPREGSALVVSDRDGAVTRVDLRNGRTRRWADACAGSVSALASSAEVTASGSYDGCLRLFDPALNHVATIDLDQGPVQSIALDPVGRHAWVGTWSGKLNRIDLDARQVESVLDACESSVRTLAFDSSGLRLCAGGDNGEIVLFGLRDGVHRILVHRQSGSTYRAVFDGAGNLWTAAGDGVRRYDRDDPTHYRTYPGTQIRWFELTEDRVYALELHGMLTVFDLASGNVLHRTRIEAAGNHRSIAILGPDRIAIASADGKVRVFDAQLQEVATLELVRDGYLWTTPAAQAHPGWLHTNLPQLLCVGERDLQTMLDPTPFAESDPKRARHLAVFCSEAHVMRIVGATAHPPDPARATVGNRLGGLNTTHRLGDRGVN